MKLISGNHVSFRSFGLFWDNTKNHKVSELSVECVVLLLVQQLGCSLVSPHITWSPRNLERKWPKSVEDSARGPILDGLLA